MLNAMPYLGKGTTRASPASTLGHHLTKTLVAPGLGAGAPAPGALVHFHGAGKKFDG